jgi:hypothetical protein
MGRRNPPQLHKALPVSGHLETGMKTIPDTPIINEALSIVKAALSKNIFNHSMRTFHLGSEYAEKYNHRFPEEELCL